MHGLWSKALRSDLFTALRSAARGCNCAPSALHVERQSPGVPACQWDDCGRFVSDLAAFGVAVVLRVLDRGGQLGEQRRVLRPVGRQLEQPARLRRMGGAARFNMRACSARSGGSVYERNARLRRMGPLEQSMHSDGADAGRDLRSQCRIGGAKHGAKGFSICAWADKGRVLG